MRPLPKALLKVTFTHSLVDGSTFVVLAQVSESFVTREGEFWDFVLWVLLLTCLKTIAA